MNKKGISEIRRAFSDTSNTFVINQFLTAIVNPNHDTQKIRYQHVSPCIFTDSHEREIYFSTLKSVLSTKLGKNFIEYAFPNKAYEENQPQNILYNVSQSGFTDDCITQKFINQIVDNYVRSTPYAIISAYCTYTVFSKNSFDEKDKYSATDYKFIVTAISAVESNESTFAFNFNTDTFIREAESNLSISRKPSDGFMFPAFNDRSADVNSVMYYTKSLKNPSISIIEDVLGCEFTMTSEGESVRYKRLLEKIVGDALSYEFILAMENEIQMFIDATIKSDTVPMLHKQDLHRIITKVFNTFELDTTLLKSYDAVYDRIVGENIPLTAGNLIDSKHLIEVPGVSVNVKDPYVCSIQPSTESGAIRIVVSVPESACTIDGISVRQ